MSDKPRGTRAAVAALGERFGALASVPATEPEQDVPVADSAAPGAATRKPRAARQPAQRRKGAQARSRTMPAEQKRVPDWPVRLQLTVDADMDRWLKEGRISDGIQATARIRAMIGLCMDDEKLAARVARLAGSPRFASYQPR